VNVTAGCSDALPIARLGIAGHHLQKSENEQQHLIGIHRADSKERSKKQKRERGRIAWFVSVEEAGYIWTQKRLDHLRNNFIQVKKSKMRRPS